MVVLLDGIDEAAGLKEELEDWLHGTLVPRGIQIVVTSRPEGVRPEKYQRRFVLMNLRPLSTEQQVRGASCVHLLIKPVPAPRHTTHSAPRCMSSSSKSQSTHSFLRTSIDTPLVARAWMRCIISTARNR